MTFVDILDSMNTTNNAAKRTGSMSGYVWKFTTAKNTLPALTTDGDYYIVFVQYNGDQFFYKHTVSDGAFAYLGKVSGNASTRALNNDLAPTTSNTLELDAVLLKHIWKGQDWNTGKQSDFDAVRIPASGTKW